jgi:hypothetical protein
MTTRWRWIFVTWGFLLAVWTSIFAYRTNPVIPMPEFFAPIPVVHCSSLLPADLWVQRWVPRECYVPE